MEKSYNNKNRMYQIVAEVVELYKPTWELIPIFVILVNEYKALLARISETAMAAGVVLTGATAGKNSTMVSLVKVLHTFCSTLALFAMRTNNKELHAKVFLSETAIKRKREGNITIFADEVVALVNQYKVPLLAGYSVTEADILRLTDTVALAKKELPVPETKYTHKKKSNDDLDMVFKETDEFLTLHFDSAVNMIHEKDEAFHKEYYFARNIKNIGIRHDPETTTTSAK